MAPSAADINPAGWLDALGSAERILQMLALGCAQLFQASGQGRTV